jgi:proteasome lid subunit RPN8/RPN11
MLRLSTAVFDDLVAHARQEVPLEACGYIGVRESTGVEAIRLTNIDHSPEHFSFDPAEQFAAVRTLRAQGLAASVVYHSHPATPARPSEEDHRLARDPSTIYCILSLAGPSPDIKAFRVENGRLAAVRLEIDT